MDSDFEGYYLMRMNLSRGEANFLNYCQEMG